MSNKALYKNICKEKSGAPLFMQPWWLDAVCAEWDAAVAKKGEHISGIWAYPVEKKMGIAMLRTPLLTPYLGPHVFYPNGVKESNLDSFEHETIAELMKQLPEAKVWHLAIEPGIKQVGLFKQYKLRAQVQQTFLLELLGNEDAIFANMKDTTRRNVRQAEKEITVSDDPACIEELYKFQEHTLSNKGHALPYTQAHLKRMMDACKINNAGALWVAKEGGNIEAIVWQVWDDDHSYYLMGGQNPKTKSYRAMTLLLWHSIKEAKKRGHKTFDFEGSMDEGVERFFRNFGGKRALYVVLHKNESLLWKMKKTLFK